MLLLKFGARSKCSQQTLTCLNSTKQALRRKFKYVDEWRCHFKQLFTIHKVGFVDVAISRMFIL